MILKMIKNLENKMEKMQEPIIKGLEELKNMHILDISPTIVDVMGLDAPREWEGKSVLRKEN